ncbi:hypothetical protein IE53DRAFT_364235 [Violaceomyces palustris]|uniref:Uncharacterized protein n=1 Tax=Violaceomyces palustris TaxID=1673888 RepID=A0ACD0NQC3_9BASI|nr:hypothetical protein IE53DRAFT_364235 [Violaceomyces palustris]
MVHGLHQVRQTPGPISPLGIGLGAPDLQALPFPAVQGIVSRLSLMEDWASLRCVGGWPGRRISEALLALQSLVIRLLVRQEARELADVGPRVVSVKGGIEGEPDFGPFFVGPGVTLGERPSETEDVVSVLVVVATSSVSVLKVVVVDLLVVPVEVLILVVDFILVVLEIVILYVNVAPTHDLEVGLHHGVAETFASVGEDLIDPGPSLVSVIRVISEVPAPAVVIELVQVSFAAMILKIVPRFGPLTTKGIDQAPQRPAHAGEIGGVGHLRPSTQAIEHAGGRAESCKPNQTCP